MLEITMQDARNSTRHWSLELSELCDGDKTEMNSVLTLPGPWKGYREQKGRGFKRFEYKERTNFPHKTQITVPADCDAMLTDGVAEGSVTIDTQYCISRKVIFSFFNVSGKKSETAVTF